MKSKTSKVLLPILGRPVVQYPIDSALKAGAKKVIVVVSPQSPLIDIIEDVDFAVQKRPLGTGHAVKIGLRKVRGDGLVLILNGDNPLIRQETIRRMYRNLRTKKADGIILTATLGNPKGYGRIIRDDHRNIVNIVEEKNLSRDQKSIKEVNAGVYIFKAKFLKKALQSIKLDKRKKEYLLTDVVAFLSKHKCKIIGMKGDINDAIGINTREEFTNVYEMLRQRYLQRFMKKGVFFEDPATVEIEPDVKIAAGVKIGSYVKIKSGSKIGKGTYIGNFSVIGGSYGQD